MFKLCSKNIFYKIIFTLKLIYIKNKCKIYIIKLIYEVKSYNSFLCISLFKELINSNLLIGVNKV